MLSSLLDRALLLMLITIFVQSRWSPPSCPILASLSTRRQLNFFRCLSLVSRNTLVDRLSLHLSILQNLSSVVSFLISCQLPDVSSQSLEVTFGLSDHSSYLISTLVDEWYWGAKCNLPGPQSVHWELDSQSLLLVALVMEGEMVPMSDGPLFDVSQLVTQHFCTLVSVIFMVCKQCIVELTQS